MKCGIDEVLNLVQEIFEENISRESLISVSISVSNRVCLFIPKNNTCRDFVCLSLPKDQQEQNTDFRPSIVTSDIDINEEFNKFKGFFEEFRDFKTAFFTEINSYKKLVSHEMSQVTSQIQKLLC